MFKFNFSSDESVEDTAVESGDEQIQKCKEVVPKIKERDDYNFKAVSIESMVFYVREFNASENLDFVNSYKDCDVIPTIYEGGLKIWECTYDLLAYLSRNSVDFSGKSICDLGCGSGLLGIYASLEKGENVHFQDYNVDVLENFTIPNVRRNGTQSSTKFFSGDWDSFVDCTPDDVYDYILCSEVLYSPKSYSKLKNLFERKLRTEGQILMATKSYYFGVGGSANEFKQFLSDTKIFSWQTVWKTNEDDLVFERYTFYNESEPNSFPVTSWQSAVQALEYEP